MSNKGPLLTFVVLLPVLVFWACHKNNNPPPKPPASPVDSTKGPVSDTLKINLNYPIAQDSLQRKYELIITEAGGKVLLDTLSPLNTPVKASLPTNAKLFDVTTVYPTLSGTYTVFTYKAVNPSTWVNAIGGSYAVPYGTPTLTGSIYYTHVPPLGTNNYPYFNSYPNWAGYSTNYLSNADQFGINYYWRSGNYVYLYLPSLGRYNLHLAKGQLDTVDLTQTDTVTMAQFRTTAGYTVYSTTLTGIPDTTNFPAAITFFNPIAHLPGVDVAFPSTVPVQKYELTVAATKGSNLSAGWYVYNKTFSNSFDLPDESNFKITSNQSDNFAVQFIGISPSWYACRFSNTGGQVYWTINAPPDSATLHPLPYFSALHPKLLQGQDMTAIKPFAFYFETVTGYNYAQYLNLVCNPAAIQSQRVTMATSLSMAF